MNHQKCPNRCRLSAYNRDCLNTTLWHVARSVGYPNTLRKCRPLLSETLREYEPYEEAIVTSAAIRRTLLMSSVQENSV